MTKVRCNFCEINNIYLYLKLSSSLPTLTEIYLIAPCPHKAYVWGCREGFYSPSHTHINFFHNFFILFSFSFIIESYRPSPQKNRHKAWQIISGDSWSFLFSYIWHDPLIKHICFSRLSLPHSFFSLFSPPLFLPSSCLTSPRFHSCGEPSECFCGHDFVFTQSQARCIIVWYSLEGIRNLKTSLNSALLTTCHRGKSLFFLYNCAIPSSPSPVSLCLV